ncbi:hypothetical protein BHE74_00025192 [Ensete ventricosum]|nr:hypothetical protein BHE74_00025192 [Ensete ventricosum]
MLSSDSEREKQALQVVSGTIERGRSSQLYRRGVDRQLRLRTRLDAVETCCRLTARRKLTSRGGTPHKVEKAEREGSGCDVKQGKGSNHGVGQVPLLVRADAIVVVHEEDGLMHKDALA